MDDQENVMEDFYMLGLHEGEERLPTNKHRFPLAERHQCFVKPTMNADQLLLRLTSLHAPHGAFLANDGISLIMLNFLFGGQTVQTHLSH